MFKYKDNLDQWHEVAELDENGKVLEEQLPFSQEQMDAINSGITADTVGTVKAVNSSYSGDFPVLAKYSSSTVTPDRTRYNSNITINPATGNLNALAINGASIVNGVATLGADGKVPSTQLPPISSSQLRTATLTTAGWTLGSDNRYYQTVAVAGVTTTTSVIIVDVDLSNADLTTKAARMTAWALPAANECLQDTGTLTFYAYDLPEVNIPINVGVF